MDEPTDRNDIEEHSEKEYRRRQFTESAWLLAFWSIGVMNEGVIRFVRFGLPGASQLFWGRPIRFWAQFLGGLFETIFGVFGLAVGLAAAVLGWYSRPITLLLLITQFLMGWYVFIVYVFVFPAFRIADSTNLLGMSRVAHNAFGTFGILTSVAMCFALQGGQFVFICRLIAYGGPTDFFFQRTGARLFAMLWNLNYALAGFWAFIGASIIIDNKGGRLTNGAFSAPPNVGRIPVYLLFVGLLMFVWPLVGILISLKNKTEVVRKYIICSFIVWLIVYVHYTIGQLGFIANFRTSAVPATGASMHNHLTVMMCFLGPYYMLKQHEALHRK